MKYKNIFSIGKRSKFEISYYKTIFKTGCNMDFTKVYGHIFSFSFQFLCFSGFLSIYK